MNRFIGRQKELQIIREVLGMPQGSLLVYGRRKVGKTTLLKEALKECRDTVVYYECLKTTEKENVAGFAAELVRVGALPAVLPFQNFTEVFSYLKSGGKRLNIVIDEYPYLKKLEKPEVIDSRFQQIIDNDLDNIHLFLSGSQISMMKDMLAEKNALYGRFIRTIHLQELNYLEASSFYPEKDIYNKAAFYAVFGGSPFVNSFLNPEKDLQENIVSVILNQASPVFQYAEHLMISDLAGSLNAERILATIANGKKKYGEIESILEMKNNGLLSKQLGVLLKMETVRKTFPINRQNDSRKVSYELCDNLLRFYYTYIYRNRSALTVLGPEAFYMEYIAPSLVTFISHRFEEICRTWFSLRVQNGKETGITNIGTYYYDDAVSHTNGEFDVVLARHSRYDIYEAKYYKTPLKEAELQAEAGKIKKIRGIDPDRIGFISVSGFETVFPEYDMIDGEQLYSV